MRFEIRQTKAGWRVYLVGANNEKIFHTEIYSSKQKAFEAVELVKSAYDAPVVVPGKRKL